MKLRRFVIQEARRTLTAPGRVVNLLDGRKRSSWGAQVETTGPDWEGSTRPYETYEQYLAHQRSKLRHVNLTLYDTQFRTALKERLDKMPMKWSGRSVLCLAARLGTEVKAFHDVGAFAVGTDIEPGPENPLVLLGDFHNVQFPDSSVETVYTNALDHALDLSKVVSEVHRVLRPGGLALVDVMKGESEGTRFDRWAATRWSDESEVADAFVRKGFLITAEALISAPWPGTSFLFSST